MLGYAPVLPQPENPERSFAGFERLFTQITELCQARVDYNQAQLRYVLQPQPDCLKPLVHQNIRAPVDYAARHYLAQIVLMTRSKRLETLAKIQAVVDQVYLECFSYHALESATIGNTPRSNLKKDIDFEAVYLESRFLEEILECLKPFLSPEMDFFLRHHTVTFARKEDSAANALTPTWKEDDFLNNQFIEYVYYLKGKIKEENDTRDLMEQLKDDQKKSAHEYWCLLFETINIENLVIENLVNDISDIQRVYRSIPSVTKDIPEYCEAYKQMVFNFNEFQLKCRKHGFSSEIFKNFLKSVLESENVPQPVIAPESTRGRDSTNQDSHTKPSTEVADQAHDFNEKLLHYRKTLDTERKTRALTRQLEEKKRTAALAARKDRQEAEAKLSEAAKKDQRLETAFVRLFPLNLIKLALLEKIFEKNVSITYREFENLFTKAGGSKHTGTLGFLESDRGGSHRKIVLPSLSTFPSIERLGYFSLDQESLPYSEVTGMTVKPHGKTHESSLSQAALAGIRATLERAGIDPMTLATFQQARACATRQAIAMPTPQALLSFHRAQCENPIASDSAKAPVATQAHPLRFAALPSSEKTSPPPVPTTPKRGLSRPKK